MIFDPPLVEATLLRRFKRFLADVRFPDGRQEVVHCPDPGRMVGLAEPGRGVLLGPTGPGARLAWSLRLIRDGRVWVVVDTQLANRLVAEALARGRIDALSGYDTVRREVPLGRGGRSRVDFVLADRDGRRPRCLLEVKSVTMCRDGLALFPDAPSERARRHLDELVAAREAGERAVLLPVVARGDGRAFDAAHEIDPRWAEALDHAAAAGVDVLPWRARVRRRGVRLDRPLPWTPRPRPAG